MKGKKNIAISFFILQTKNEGWRGEEDSFLKKIYKYDIPSVPKCVKGTVVFYTPHHSSRGPQLMSHKLSVGVLWFHLQSSPGSDCPGLSGSSPFLADTGMPSSAQLLADPVFFF